MITYNVALDQFELLILILMRMASFVFAAQIHHKGLK